MSRVPSIKKVEEHRLSDGSTAEVTRLGRTWNFNRWGGGLEVPECHINVGKTRAYEMLAEVLRNDVLEVDP